MFSSNVDCADALATSELNCKRLEQELTQSKGAFVTTFSRLLFAQHQNNAYPPLFAAAQARFERESQELKLQCAAFQQACHSCKLEIASLKNNTAELKGS